MHILGAFLSLFVLQKLAIPPSSSHLNLSQASSIISRSSLFNPCDVDLTERLGEVVSEIEEPLAQAMIENNLKELDVPVSTEVASSGKITTTFASFTSPQSIKRKESTPFASGNLFANIMANMNVDGAPFSSKKTSNKSSKIEKSPIVMLHGFDSSCLEYRRLAPLLNQAGYDVFIPDILGWGFSSLDMTDIQTVGPAAKMEHLVNFCRSINGGGPVTLVGASLGGALACILAAEHPELVDKVVLIDAQGFIDGEGPSSLPRVFAELGETPFFTISYPLLTTSAFIRSRLQIDF